MKTNKSIQKTYRILTFLLAIPLCFGFLTAQQEGEVEQMQGLVDSLSVFSDDSLSQAANDSLPLADSVEVKSTVDIPMNEGELKDEVQYYATDSIFYDIINEKIYLYGNAHIEQKEMSLDAGIIIFEYSNQEVIAMPTLDSLGEVTQKPIFKEGEDEFFSDTLRYNFETEKGRISQLITKEGDGYLRSEAVKKNEFDEMFGSNAFYTTCNHEHPHFRIQAKKVKVVPKKVIVTGPANLYVGNVPTPLYLPFGIFPISPGRQSGIILPTYGHSPNLGFYLRGGGVYLGISEYVDLAIRSDYYSRGSWGVNVSSQYKKRYRYNGRLSLKYGTIREGFTFQDDFRSTRDFFVNWTHTQDPKSIPNSTFTASVNAGTTTYNQNFVTTDENYLRNDFSSSINFSRRFPGTPFSMNLNASHSQNTNTKIVVLTLPELTFSMTKQNPFKRKSRIGKEKWYEKIGVSYNSRMRNRVSVPDSLVFTNEVWSEMRNGMVHTVPVNMSFNMLKYITVTPAATYNEYWYLKGTQKEWDPTVVFDTIYDSEGGFAIDTINGQLIESEENGFTTGRDFNTSLTLRTTLTGTKLFTKGRVRGIQHVMRPRISASWRPDFGEESWGYYKEVQSNAAGDIERYSIFENGILNGPPDGGSARISYGIDNILEIKTRSPNDSTETDNKLKILESLSISSNYDFGRDSLRMGDISISARTKLFNKLNITFRSSHDPYIRDSDGRRRNVYEWTENKRWARLKNASLTLGTSISSKGFGGSNQVYDSNDGVFSDDYTIEEQLDVYENPNDYVDFNIPWSLSVDYILRIDKSASGEVEMNNYNQTLNLRMDFNLTPQWKVDIRTGYDFDLNALSLTTINIRRDLHCWEMNFAWRVNGDRKSYDFTLRAKSSLLQDLKISRKRGWYDL